MQLERGNRTGRGQQRIERGCSVLMKYQRIIAPDSMGTAVQVI